MGRSRAPIIHSFEAATIITDNGSVNTAYFTIPSPATFATLALAGTVGAGKAWAVLEGRMSSTSPTVPICTTQAKGGQAGSALAVPADVSGFAQFRVVYYAGSPCLSRDASASDLVATVSFFDHAIPPPRSFEHIFLSAANVDTDETFTFAAPFVLGRAIRELVLHAVVTNWVAGTCQVSLNSVFGVNSDVDALASPSTSAANGVTSSSIITTNAEIIGPRMQLVLNTTVAPNFTIELVMRGRLQ